MVLTERFVPVSKKQLANVVRATGFALAIFVVLFLAANYQYFWKQINFKPTPVEETAGQQNIGVIQNAITLTPHQLFIPSLSLRAPVQYADKANEKTFQAALINGVVHYPGTAMPGQAGNDFIFGHSSDYIWSKGHYKTIFAVLPKIKVGDTVYISDSAKTFAYRVTDTLIVKPTDVAQLRQDFSKSILTLQTSYPVGTALRRFIVHAELIPSTR